MGRRQRNWQSDRRLRPWVDSGRGGSYKRVGAGLGKGEYLGLAVVGVAKRNTGKMAAHPAGEESGGDDGLALAPRGDLVEREGLGQAARRAAASTRSRSSAPASTAPRRAAIAARDGWRPTSASSSETAIRYPSGAHRTAAPAGAWFKSSRFWVTKSSAIRPLTEAGCWHGTV